VSFFLGAPTIVIMSDDYVIVTETYPTSYGCNRGRNWNRAEMICRTDVDVSTEKYSNYNEAVTKAREIRDNSEWFTDYEPPAGDDDLPPFNSRDLRNYDNDEEILIRVMKQSEIDKERADDQEYLELAREKARFEATLKSELVKIQVRDSGGKVFYSRMYPDSQIPAEFEFDESKDDGSKFVLPTNANEIKSVMYKVRDDKDHRDKVLRGDKAVLFDSDLMKLLMACTSLEELYLQSSGFQTHLDKEFIEGVVTKAPHLKDTLKVLSVRGPGLELPPWTFKAIGKSFNNLTRLDVSDVFSTEYWNDPDPFSDEYRNKMPYDEPLIECIRNLSHLRRLDLGNGDPEMRRYLYDYSLSHNAVRDAKDLVDNVTMDRDNMPEPFSSHAREEKAREEALNMIIKNASGEYSEALIKLARNKLNGASDDDMDSDY